MNERIFDHFFGKFSLLENIAEIFRKFSVLMKFRENFQKSLIKFLRKTKLELFLSNFRKILKKLSKMKEVLKKLLKINLFSEKLKCN